MIAKRVCVAFDYDLNVRQNLIAQSKSPDCFELVDNSITALLPDTWAAEARSRIAASDCVIALCGEQIHQANGVTTALQSAQEQDKRYFLLQGTRSGAPRRLPSARATENIWALRWPAVSAFLEGKAPPRNVAR